MRKQSIFIASCALTLLATFSCGNNNANVEYNVHLSDGIHLKWMGEAKAKKGKTYKAKAKIDAGYKIETNMIKIEVGDTTLTAGDYSFCFDSGSTDTMTLAIFGECVTGEIKVTGDAMASDYINVADYVDITGTKDTSAIIQSLIDNNPHRTLYFQDGTYLFDKQILTPGDPRYTVDLQLSNFAILKASDTYQVKRTGTKKDFQDDYLYMVSLGGKDRENDTKTPGSNFSMTGGIIDGSGKASGVEIAGGREVRVQNVSMKGVEVGLRIAPGVNSRSSDADLLDLNIICNETKNSLGMLLDGFDNSVTNVRIGHTLHGVKINGGGNVLRNIHPLLCGGGEVWSEYDDSYGFEVNNENILDYCYSDNFHVAFKIPQSRALFHDCFAWWWNPQNHAQILIQNGAGTANAPHFFRSIFTNLQVGFDSAEGHFSSDHPSLILDNKETTTDTAYTPDKPFPLIHNIAVCNRNTLNEKIHSEQKDAYHNYFDGVDIDY